VTSFSPLSPRLFCLLAGFLAVAGLSAPSSLDAQAVRVQPVVQSDDYGAIVHHETTDSLIVTVATPDVGPASFYRHPRTGGFEIYSGLTTLIDDRGLTSIGVAAPGAFIPGEVYGESDETGQIIRIAADGASFQNPWVTLQEPPGVFQTGGITHDAVGTFDHCLIVTTVTGNVWRIDASGAVIGAAPLVSVAGPLIGATVLPADPGLGPLAGTLLTYDEDAEALLSITASGAITAFPLAIEPMSISYIPRRANFFSADGVTNMILGIPATDWVPYIGQILITDGAGVPGTSGLYALAWDGTTLVTTEVPLSADSTAPLGWLPGVFAMHTATGLCPTDSDADGTPDCLDVCPNDPDKLEPGQCGCGNPESDFDLDGICDVFDPDDDNDGVPDGLDTAPQDPFACRDADGDGCDDCVSGIDAPADDGVDFDADGLCDSGDPDDDNDGIMDTMDSAPFDSFLCGDFDADGCEDCVSGSYSPGADGLDTDADGLCDLGDPDDDGDGVADALDSAPLNAFVCGDSDGDGCDDCSSGLVDLANDGTDTDGDGLCDLGDPDDDGDGVADAEDSAPLDPFQCRDADLDGCDDCSSGFDRTHDDGVDTDADGICDLGDDDDDNDGVADAADIAPLNAFLCQDSDGDGCDDCSGGSFAPLADGVDTDADGLCDLGDPDDDNDGVVDTADAFPLDPFRCQDSDGDGCDDCASGVVAPADDGLDTDGDGLCDLGDSDDDNDGVEDSLDLEPLNPLACRDADLDGCDDCSSGLDAPANDGVDTDGDGLCDLGDSDDDNDGVEDAADSSPLDPFLCQDSDADGCDDCASGIFAPTADGTDTDGDGLCDLGDPDDDNDGVVDGQDAAPLDPFQCVDSDADGCDDCSSGLYAPSADGTDTDGDGLCDLGDPDDDNDGVEDAADSNPLDPFLCQDSDSDGCDDCSSGLYAPADDGVDTDADGLCDAGDPDDDNDGVNDGADSAPLNPFVCQDSDADGCDDCSSGLVDASADGPDNDGDGICDLGDPDDDNDGIVDDADSAPFDAFVCLDSDADGCDDCSSGHYDPAGDGADNDGDGICDLGDEDDDNDGAPDVSDEAPFDPLACSDHDGDGCDDCSQGLYDPAADGVDTDGDGLCDAGDDDDDNDGVLDGTDSSPLDPLVCSDVDGDGCDDCASGLYDPAADGADNDGDGLCDLGDPDDDNDGVMDGADSAPFDPFLCQDSDGDGCDDCASGVVNPSDDGVDTDGDGLCDLGDPDDDNDGVVDSRDDAPLDPFACQDSDADGCDDCSSGVVNQKNDGADNDGDGLCDLGDPDDDNDGVVDGADSAPFDPFVCQDSDADGCDDCSSGLYDPASDGADNDGDGICDLGDPDDDNDGVMDAADSAPLDPFVCQDSDGDGCDDCASGSVNPASDGADNDGDGICDAGDPDDDNDGVEDAADSAPLDPFVCQDVDGDGCDDCASGLVDPSADGTDTDGDGLCDLSDPDDDNDGVSDGSDSAPLDPFACQDADADGCDDCSSGVVDPFDDGIDSDLDGVCDSGDGCPTDPTKSEPGICGCGSTDDPTDTDGDGTADCADLCPIDPEKSEPGDCGCGFEDLDFDGNGITDCLEDLFFVRADANADANLDISDPIFILNYLFQGGPGPVCRNAADANDDMSIDLADGVYIMGYIFLEGPAPVTPWPDCGPEAAPGSSLGCEAYGPCAP